MCMVFIYYCCGVYHLLPISSSMKPWSDEAMHTTYYLVDTYYEEERNSLPSAMTRVTHCARSLARSHTDTRHTHALELFWDTLPRCFSKCNRISHLKRCPSVWSKTRQQAFMYSSCWEGTNERTNLKIQDQGHKKNEGSLPNLRYKCKFGLETKTQTNTPGAVPR